jgi:hypothetical protein
MVSTLKVSVSSRTVAMAFPAVYLSCRAPAKEQASSDVNVRRSPCFRSPPPVFGHAGIAQRETDHSSVHCAPRGQAWTIDMFFMAFASDFAWGGVLVLIGDKCIEGLQAVLLAHKRVHRSMS